MPFTGDSSDDSSDGEEHAVMMTHNSHNSSSTDNTETSTSGSASSPSKSLKTSSSLSPAKRSGSESPKNKTRGRIENVVRLLVLVFGKIWVHGFIRTFHWILSWFQQLEFGLRCWKFIHAIHLNI